ncbi:hypothetical protein [Salibaculum sp.]|uniref:hypothetical protein n=1 Tax=Salibaculum sp. TaxID=2855480 RepID=UPI002B4693A6|nr:hypothetical protein [Salibaculum sp.]HKL69191.1 hypothetical protein [Salibaculum sp.]
MSDPVKNVEIEDVLSSIRKLVSEGEQARARETEPSQAGAGDAGHRAGQDPAESRAAEEDRPAKLVLTPAQLVTQGDDAFVGHSRDDEEAPRQTAEAEAPEATEGDVVPHLLDRPIGNFLRRDESEGPEPADSGRDVTQADASGPDQDGSETDSAVSETAQHEMTVAEQPAETPVGDSATPENRRSALEATIAELEASVGGEGFEPDGSEAANMAATLAWPRSRRSRINFGAEAARTVQDAPEEVVSAAEDDPSNEDTTAEDLARGTGPDDPYDASYDEELSGLEALDAAALRALVAEIVREELQGALGERITRNVRKLVRREIYRILSSQDFD